MSAAVRAATFQWTFAVSMLQEARHAAGRVGPMASTVAVVTAMAAAEASLEAIAAMGVQRPDRSVESFEQLLKRAVTAAGSEISTALARELGAVQRIRNTAVHGGSASTTADASRAVSAAAEVVVLLPRVVFGKDRGEVGIAGVVATLAPLESVATRLGQPDEALAGGFRVTAVDHAAIAFEIASRRAAVPVPDQSRHARYARDPLEKALSSVQVDIWLLGDWIFGLALGTRPREFARFQALLGSPTRGDRGSGMVNRPTWAEAELERVGVAEDVVNTAAMLLLNLAELGVLESEQEPRPIGWGPWRSHVYGAGKLHPDDPEDQRRSATDELADHERLAAEQRERDQANADGRAAAEAAGNQDDAKETEPG